MQELTKGEKKIARELIEKSVVAECRDFMKNVEAMVNDPANREKEPRERFWEYHKQFRDFGKHLTRRYDGLGGSQYASTVLHLYLDKLVTKEEVERFTPEIQEWIFGVEKRNEEYKKLDNTP